MSLDVQIKIDGADKAVTESKRVEDALGKVEDKGPAVGESVERGMERASRAAQNLGRNFSSLQGPMTRLAQAHETHARLSNTVAQGFAGVAAAIAREQQMLASIHGPARQFEQDLQTLDRLQKQGAISASQYATQLDKLRSRAGMANPAAAISLPGRGAKEGDSATKQPGMLSGLKGAAAAAGIAFGVNEIKDLSDGYTNLSNRIRQVSTSQENFSSLMSRTREIANNTRSDWGTTAEAFVRLTQATKGMGLSQERGLKITETLNMALQSSGASASEASAGTLQLMQAMAAGALQGDEFRSISENIPVVMDLLAKQLGVTRGELKKLGAEGKITSEQMVKALEGGATKIREQFAKTDLSMSQWVTTMKNDVQAGVGFALKPLGDLEAQAKKLAQAEDLETKKVIDLLKANNMLAESSKTLAIQGRANLLLAEQAIDKNGQLVKIFKAQYDMMMAIKGIHFDDPWGDNRSTWTRFKERIGDKIHGAIGEINKRTKEWTESLKDAGNEAEKLRKTWAKFMNAPSRTSLLEDRPDRGLVARAEAHEGFSQDVGLEDSPSDLTKDLADKELKAKEVAQLEADRQQRLANLHESEMERLREEQKGFDTARQRMADGFADIFADIEQQVADGKASFNDLIRTFTTGALRQLSSAAIGEAFKPDRMFGFASGGMIKPGGTGGIDTQPIAFMKSPDETVRVTTPAQESQLAAAMRGGGQGGSGRDSKQPITVVLDERKNEYATERFIVKVLKRNAPALRGPITGR